MSETNKMQEEIDKQLENVGELQIDEDGREYRIINGRKCYQMKCRSKKDEEIQRNINAYRASGFSSPFEWLKSMR